MCRGADDLRAKGVSHPSALLMLKPSAQHRPSGNEGVQPGEKAVIVDMDSEKWSAEERCMLDGGRVGDGWDA